MKLNLLVQLRNLVEKWKFSMVQSVSLLVRDNLQSFISLENLINQSCFIDGKKI